ncbi:MAG: hypothetical protein JW895_02515 [Thermoleophilaceae bacterium]|nr:hypothetical protein [Thermoleophilaceae bacterium]
MELRRASLLALALVALGAPPAAAAPLNRPDDPVVVTGAGVPTLTGAAPGRIAAFAWSGAWQQIPVQVDERKLVDLRSAYPSPFSCGGNSLCFTPFSTPAKLRYADPGTRIGADPNPALDGDDEIAFMAKDAGSAAAGAATDPPGVLPGTRREIVITDPLDGGRGYVYLFRHDGSLDPAAGRSYVTYTFSLATGPYLTTYKHAAGSNTETSSVSTPYYSRAFIDRWRESELRVLRSGASGADVLDRNENQFFPDYCGRSRLTFAQGEGAFLANRSGPVRAIRAFVGANSGPMTEHQQIFYEGREEDTTFLRVHSIPAVMSFLDYSAAASGMTYRNNNNTGGVTIDGAADTVAAGPLTWESVDGPQGAVTSVHTWSTTVAASKFTSFYRDSASPPSGQAPCQGDSGYYGASGPFVNGSIADTNEPTNGGAPDDRLTTTRTLFFGAPGTSSGALRRQQVSAPLTTNARPPVTTPPAGPGPAVPPPAPAEPKAPAKPRVKLALKVRYGRARGCARRVALLTVAGTGLDRVARAGLRLGSRKLGTDRTRPFRMKVTRRALHGRGRARVRVGVRLRGGRLVTLRARVRGLC